MAAITIRSDFWSPQNKVWHCFHCFSIYFPWTNHYRNANQNYEIHLTSTRVTTTQKNQTSFGEDVENLELLICCLWECKMVCVHMCVFSCSVVSDSLQPMDCSPPGSSVHGILPARIRKWVAIPFSRGSSQPRNWTQVSCITGSFLTNWAMREAPNRKF